VHSTKPKAQRQKQTDMSAQRRFKHAKTPKRSP
jgi:hypothetical protein